jgi:hypothetical protein
MATLFVEGVPELQDVGTTLSDIRITYQTAFIRDHGTQNAHRSNAFVLGNGQQYDFHSNNKFNYHNSVLQILPIFRGLWL